MTGPARASVTSFTSLARDERMRVLAGILDYRGDVTLRLDDGSLITGYVFTVDSREPEPHVRLMTAETGDAKVRVPLARIEGVEFSGRDMADGRSWEAWVARHEERARLRAQGLDVPDIEPQPEQI